LSLRLKDVAADGQEAVALAPFRSEDGTFFPFPATGWRGALRTPPLKLRPGEAPPELFLDVILPPGSRSIEVDVSRIEVRPVSSPVRP
ncbi:SGNH/GDSL hydrolase family protein, partial [Rhizobium sp. BR5]